MSTFPAHLKPESIIARESWPMNFTQFRSGAVQRYYRGGHFFEFDVSWPPYDHRYHRDLMAFIAAQSGALQSFEFVYPQSGPLGTAAGTPVIRGAFNAGAETIETRSWQKNAKVLLPGDLIRIKQKAYRVLEKVTSNSNGRATIKISPGLFQSALDSEGVVVRGISFRVFLQQDTVESVAINLAPGIHHQTSLTLREDWT